MNGGDGRPVVLASDAVHYYEELEHDRPFAIYSDLDGMVAGYETVRGSPRKTPPRSSQATIPWSWSGSRPFRTALPSWEPTSADSPWVAVDCMTIIRYRRRMDAT